MQTFQMIQILKRKAKVLLLWQMQIGQKEYYILNFCDKINFSFLYYLKIIIFLTGPRTYRNYRSCVTRHKYILFVKYFKLA